MEGTTSTSNEGSKRRDLTKYKQAETRNVSRNEIDENFSKCGYTFSLNCMACNVNNNIKTANSENPVSASSADTKKFDRAEILENTPWVTVRQVTPEKADIIDKKRKQAKAKKQAEKEAAEALEAEKKAELEKQQSTGEK